MELTFYLCDANRMETGVLPDECMLDIEVGGGYNDTQLICKAGPVVMGGWLFSPGTEYIACFEEMSISTDSPFQTWTGNGIRKFLEQAIICPPAGQDYKIVNGEANAVIRGLVNGLYGGLFEVPDEDSGIYLSNWKFDRYCTVLEGIEKMLKSKGAKVQIKAIQGGSGERFRIEMCAVPIRDFSRDVEWSEDSGRTAVIVDNRRGVNHLICLGRGELKDREVVHLYAWPDRTVQRTQHYKGFDERTEVYDNTGAESTADLIKGGTERLTELMGGKTMTVSIQDGAMEIGDVVGGKSYEHGVTFRAAITKKILTVSDGIMAVEYMTED